MEIDKIKQYDEYLRKHLANVKLAFTWLTINLDSLFKDFPSGVVYNNIIQHDGSKFWEEEYDAYCEYFYGDKKRAKEDFDRAWLHHIHHNPHHWQYWLLHQDDGGMKPLEMPFECVVEMVCDHWAFSFAKENLYEIFDWYEKNKSKMVLHENTRKLYEDILDQIKSVLDNRYGNEEQ